LHILSLLAALWCAYGAAAATPMGTAFSYQGRLFDGTNAANGRYDIRFILWDSASGGSSVGPTLTTNGMAVANGLFLITLDFGAVFDGTARWLDIAVKTNGGAVFSNVTPRQPLTPAPYAEFAGNASALGGLAPGAFAPASGSAAYVAKTGDTMSGPLFLPANGLTAGGSQLVLKSGAVGIGGDPGDALLDVKGNLRLNDYDVFLRYNNGDRGHGLGWYNTSLKPFGSYGNLDGPVLYGCASGGLGSLCGGTNLSLMWAEGGRLSADPGSENIGGLLPGLLFGGLTSAEGIASKRNAGGNQFGLDFYTWGSNRLSITQSGKVGIGTTSPLKALDVFDGTGTNGTGGNIHIGGYYANGDAKLIHFGDLMADGRSFVYLGENGQDDRLEFRAGTFYFNNGSVGIGTTNPASILDVAGTVTAQQFIGSGAGLTGGTVPGGAIADNSVTSAKLASDANSLSKVTAGKMSASASSVSLSVPEYLNDNDIYLRGDALHGLGWYGNPKYFGSSGPNGPVIYGFNGGGLGTKHTSYGTNLLLGWSNTGVTVDPEGRNTNSLTWALRFGADTGGEGIASKRTAGGNQFGLDFYTGSTPRLSIDNAGRVGIGTTTPSDAHLDVHGDIRLNETELLFRSGTDRNHGLGWYGAGKTFAGYSPDGPVLYGCSGGGLGTLCTSPQMVLSWNNLGNVFLDPGAINSGNLGPGLVFGGTSSGEGISSKRTAGGSGFGLDFYTYGSNRVSITQLGKVGIGTNSPQAALHVTATGPTETRLTSTTSGAGDWSVGTGWTTPGTRSFYLFDNVAAAPRVVVNSSGNVGIGTNSPQSPLSVAGSVRASGLLRLGSETNSTSNPNYPAGSDGLLIRRITSTSSTSNNIVARTDSCILARDGTAAGLMLIYDASSLYQNITCMAVDRSGASVNYKNNMIAGSGRLYVFNDSQKIVHYDISFGNVYNGGHTCHVVLDRFDNTTTSDNFLVGTITTTYNQ